MAKKIDLKLGLKGAKKTEKGLGKVDSKLKSLGKSAMLAAGGFFAARGLINAFKSVVDAAAAQELAEKKLEAVLKSTSHAAGLQANELKKLAASLQQTTMFGDETIIGAQSLMLTFTKIGKDIFPDAIETVLNMSTAMGTDLQSSVIQLGKALNAPVEGISALSRVGVQLTEDQKGQIRSFVEMGEVAEAQKVILGELETQFGGMAKAAGETMAGSLEQMKNAVGDAAEAIGDVLSPVVVDLAEDIKFVAEWWGNWIQKVKESKDLNKAETNQTKELTQKINALTSEIEHRLEVLRDEGLLKKRAEDQNNTIFRQSAMERLEIAKLKIELKKLNEEREKAVEIAENQPPPVPPLEGFDLFLEKQRVNIALKQQESEWLDKIKEQYPALAEAMGLVVEKTDDANSGWETFQKNLDKAAAASVLTASSITSTSDALGAAEEAAKRAAIAFISAEIQKAVAKWIASMLESSGPLAWLTAPLALAGGAAFGSLMGSAIERISFAQGGQFITSGPQSILVGDNPGGRERVSVEPLSSPNINGPQGNITLNISAPLVDETVIDTIIPAIEKAQRQNLA